MRQDLSSSVTSRITVFNMHAQFLHMVDALLSDENSTSFEAYQAEGLLMDGLHVAAQALLVGEGLLS